MEIEFWKQRWSNNQIGFHQETVNPYLSWFYGEKGPSVETRNKLKVFVPLCGKSRDMLWLAQNGYQVFGAECSETAVNAFFEENSLNYKSASNEHGALYQSPAVENRWSAIEIFQGDAQIDMCFGIGGVNLQRLVVVLNRILHPAKSQKGIRQVVMYLDVGRIYL